MKTKYNEAHKQEALDGVYSVQCLLEGVLGTPERPSRGMYNKKCVKKLRKATNALEKLFELLSGWEEDEGASRHMMPEGLDIEGMRTHIINTTHKIKTKMDHIKAKYHILPPEWLLDTGERTMYNQHFQTELSSLSVEDGITICKSLEKYVEHEHSFVMELWTSGGFTIYQKDYWATGEHTLGHKDRMILAVSGVLA